MRQIFQASLILLACLGASNVEAGLRSPDSLVRNVYAYYGNGTPELSRGLPRDEETAREFFDSSLPLAWTVGEERTLRFSGAELQLEALRHLDFDFAQAIRRDLCGSRLRQ